MKPNDNYLVSVWGSLAHSSFLSERIQQLFVPFGYSVGEFTPFPAAASALILDQSCTRTCVIGADNSLCIDVVIASGRVATYLDAWACWQSRGCIAGAVWEVYKAHPMMASRRKLCNIVGSLHSACNGPGV